MMHVFPWGTSFVLSFLTACYFTQNLHVSCGTISSLAALVSFLQGGRQLEAEQCYKYAVKVRVSALLRGRQGRPRAAGERGGSRPRAFPCRGALALLTCEFDLTMRHVKMGHLKRWRGKSCPL